MASTQTTTNSMARAAAEGFLKNFNNKGGKEMKFLL